MTYTLCKPTLKHHQYKHHLQHKSLDINPILTRCRDDHPAVRHASTCETDIHKSNTKRPKRANHHGTYKLQTNTQTPSTTQINQHQSHTYSLNTTQHKSINCLHQRSIIDQRTSSNIATLALIHESWNPPDPPTRGVDCG